MKKRCLSFCLLVTLLAALSAPCLHASAVTDATVVTGWSCEDGLTGDSRIASDSGTGSTRYIQKSGSDTAQALTVIQLDEPYALGTSISMEQCKTIVCNHRANLSSYITEQPVIAAECKMFIPDDANQTETRDFKTILGSVANSGSSTYGAFTVRLSGGAVSLVGANGTTVQLVDEHAAYKVGDWNTILVEAQVTADAPVSYKATVNGTVVGTGSSSASYDGGAITVNQLMWDQASWTAGTPYATYIDDVSISVGQPDASAPIGYSITSIGFDEADPTASKIGASTGVSANALVHSGQTTLKTDPSYTREAAGADTGDYALVVTGTRSGDDAAAPRIVMVQNARQAITNYTKAEAQERVLVASYEILVPEGEEGSARKHSWGFTGDTSSLSASQFQVTSTIKDGQLTFALGGTYPGNPLTERSEAAAVASGAWQKVSYVLKLNYSSESAGYDIWVYGLLGDKRVYEKQLFLPSADGGFGIVQQRLEHTLAAGSDAITTKLNNLDMTVMPASRTRSTTAGARQAMPIRSI